MKLVGECREEGEGSRDHKKGGQLMKAKWLLGGLLISSFWLTGCESQVKQLVSAETQETQELQEETFSESSSAAVSTNSEETAVASSSIPAASSASLAGKSSSTVGSSEMVPQAASTEASVEPKPATVQEIQPPLPAEKVEENYQFSVARNQTTEEFIQTIAADAQQIAWDEGLYASMMIAQAILETGSGNSQLAQPPHHNLFGIKGSYQGKQVAFATQEDQGNGQLYTIQSAFRQYPSYKESLEDYAALLKNGISGNGSFYQAAWKENAATYQEAAKALTGRYATDTSYDKKLTALIEAYELTLYDQEPTTEAEVKEEREKPTASSEKPVLQEESKETSEQEVLVNITKQKVVTLPPVAQRPAKQLSGNRVAE